MYVFPLYHAVRVFKNKIYIHIDSVNVQRTVAQDDVGYLPGGICPVQDDDDHIHYEMMINHYGTVFIIEFYVYITDTLTQYLTTYVPYQLVNGMTLSII